MRRVLLVALVVLLVVACNVIPRRLLIASGGSGGFTVPASEATLALFNGYDSTTSYKIGAATKSGGVWTKYGSNPVISPGTAGAWDDAHVKDPWLMWDGSQFVAYYSGNDGSKYQIGRATASSITGTWTKDAGNPLLTVGSGGAFDDAGVNFPTLLYEPSDTGREWKMWYGSDDGSVQRVGYAYSSDGTTWTKVGQVLDVGSSGTWEDESVLPFGIVKSGSTYYLFYGGRQGTSVARWQGGVVTFTDPEGTYTKEAGNPIMLARFNDAGASKTLTANASGSTLTVADTTGWNVGEPMAIADGDSQSAIRTIISIDSGTQVTLDSALPSTYSTAMGAVARPVAFNSLVPRTVRQFGSSWEAFVTPFQPVEDLTVGGTKLRELSMRMTASSLTGPWSYDYTTGLLWKLGSSGAWDEFSAENPSTLAAP